MQRCFASLAQTAFISLCIFAALTGSGTLASAAPSTELMALRAIDGRHSQGHTSNLPAPCLIPGASCTWQRTFGGNLEDKAFAAASTPSNGIFLAGHSRSFTGSEYDGLILRLNATGEMLWQRSVGGPGSDQLFGIVATDDGGAVAAGHARLGRGYRGDAWVVRLDRYGDVVWEKIFGDYGKEDRANAVAKTKDGGFVVVGFTQSSGAGADDSWIIRLNADGVKIWEKTLGTSKNDGAHHVAVNEEGAITVAGYSYSNNAHGYDATVHRLSPNGDVLWERRLDDGRFDIASTVADADDGGVLIAGQSNSGTWGRESSWAVRFNTYGTEIWKRTFSGAGKDLAYSAMPLPDGGFVLALGSTSRGAGSSDAWVVRLNANGHLVWERTYGGSLWDRPAMLSPMSDGGLILSGSTTTFGAGYEDFWLLRLDAGGNL